MEIKTTYLILLTFLFCFLMQSCSESNHESLKSEILDLNQGYGYEIYYKNKLLIRQTVIPGAQGNQTFKTKEQAKIIASFVINKIKTKQSPTVVEKDLDSLKVLFKK